MKFFNEYKRQFMILAVIALVIISIFTAGKTIKIAGVDDALGFIITPFQGAVNIGNKLGWRLRKRNNRKYHKLPFIFVKEFQSNRSLSEFRLSR